MLQVSEWGEHPRFQARTVTRAARSAATEYPSHERSEKSCNLLETFTDVRAKSDRPLDCWKEVEAFKNEVNKLESVSWLAVSSSGS